VAEGQFVTLAHQQDREFGRFAVLVVLVGAEMVLDTALTTMLVGNTRLQELMGLAMLIMPTLETLTLPTTSQKVVP
jgi:hypothetical protein